MQVVKVYDIGIILLYPSNEPCRLTYKKFDFGVSNDEIAQTMIELLNDIKNYRDKKFPLN